MGSAPDRAPPTAFQDKRVTDRDEIDRLNGIGLPPAYRDAWFCPDANGHIQAIGYDDRGRKQYRYHPDFRERREAAKYDRCREFGVVVATFFAKPEKREELRDMLMGLVSPTRREAGCVDYHLHVVEQDPPGRRRGDSARAGPTPFR